MKFLVAAAITATASVRAAVPAFPRVRYDRGITTFSPDGSLLQVEYAMSVGEKGAPALAVTDDEGGVFLIAEASDDESDDLLSMGEKLIELDEHVWMAVSGFRADGRVLGDRARQECQEYRLSYGEAPTVRHVAAFVADLQHGFTRTGGARPFGVSCLIVGLDPVTGLSYKDVDYGTATAASRVSRTGGSTGDTGTGDTVTDDNGTDDSTIGNSGGTSGNSVGTLGGSETSTSTSTSGGSSGGSLEGGGGGGGGEARSRAPPRSSALLPFSPLNPSRQLLRLLSGSVAEELHCGVTHVLVDPSDTARFHHIKERVHAIQLHPKNHCTLRVVTPAWVKACSVAGFTREPSKDRSETVSLARF